MKLEIPAGFKGKEAFYEKLIKMFVKDLPENFSDYSTAIADITNTKAFVHKTKGTAGNLAIKELYEAALEFEISLREGTPQEELYNKFTAACEKVKNSVSA